MSSVTLGTCYDAGHLCRALCCRMDMSPESLPATFRLNHPCLSRGSTGDQNTCSADNATTSLNWCLGDAFAEVVHSSSGRLLEGDGTDSAPRISKFGLATLFVNACNAANFQELLSMPSYAEAKHAATLYCEARQALLDHCKSRRYGEWSLRPMEQEQFSLPDIKYKSSVL